MKEALGRMESREVGSDQDVNKRAQLFVQYHSNHFIARPSDRSSDARRHSRSVLDRTGNFGVIRFLLQISLVQLSVKETCVTEFQLAWPCPYRPIALGDTMTQTKPHSCRYCFVSVQD